jgi:Family of unknown function (DUF5313)
MARLPGDPGVLGWIKFAAGFRLPDENLDWVRHELTDAGWRARTVWRHLAIIIPICVLVAAGLLVLSPAPAWFAVMMVALILCGSVFTVAAYGDDIRASRLRQHGLDVPDDPDLGHPTH